MRVIRAPQQMGQAVDRLRARGQRIGVVPTMGALHEGHCSLIRRAARECDAVIVTIFVNPLQFGPREDFRRYPRPLATDLRLAASAGATLAFVPPAASVFPPGFQTRIAVGRLGAIWEGKVRPGHFTGVATVVSILFNLTRPHRAYFGQKDLQQTLVIRQLIRDLGLPITLRVLPTRREPDGLAMSSRNAYLDADERRRALALWQALRAAREAIRRGERRSARVEAAMRWAAKSVRVQYAAAVDADTLARRPRLSRRSALIIAATVGKTRLIDNLLVDV